MNKIQSSTAYATADAPVLLDAAFIIPTYNAGEHMLRIRAALQEQGVHPSQVLIIDSSSTDGTQEVASQAGFKVYIIPKEEFRHGRTRQAAAKLMADARILVFLTQDAIPTGLHSLANLLKAFEDSDVGAAYGRQLPRPGAGLIERHSREWNYPEESAVRSYDDRKRLGFRTVFFSNSFAAYRKEAFQQVEGFPDDAIVSEEVTVVARMLKAGWKCAYRADATVIHSHQFTPLGIFSRYFDIGVHHARTSWILKEFGEVGGEGKRFLVSEMKSLLRNEPSQILSFIAQSAGKFLGYRMGYHEARLPLWLKRRFSAQPTFWDSDQASGEDQTPRS